VSRLVVEIPSSLRSSMRGLGEFLRRCLDAALGQCRQPLRVAFAVGPQPTGLTRGDHRSDHPPTADAHDVAGHPGELDVGFFQRLLNALDVPGLIAHQLLAGAHQRAQSLEGFVRAQNSP
jgi:hypothetical protein